MQSSLPRSRLGDVNLLKSQETYFLLSLIFVPYKPTELLYWPSEHQTSELVWS